MGDFNCDVSNLTTGNCLLAAFQKLCNLFDLTQIIHDFTRVTSISQSIIDLILVSDCEKVLQSGVIPTGISDHFLIFCTRKVHRGQINGHKSVKSRSLKIILLQFSKIC